MTSKGKCLRGFWYVNHNHPPSPQICKKSIITDNIFKWFRMPQSERLIFVHFNTINISFGIQLGSITTSELLSFVVKMRLNEWINMPKHIYQGPFQESLIVTLCVYLHNCALINLCFIKFSTKLSYKFCIRIIFRDCFNIDYI